MIIRRVAVVGIVLAGMLALGGCDGSPAPAASTPPFASEEEAFAAAEETYRAYVDAGNTRAADPSSASDPLTYLIGDALEAESSAESPSPGVTTEGGIEVQWFEGIDASETLARIRADSCLDLSQTRLVNAAGEDVTPPSRPNFVGISVAFVLIGAEYKIDQLVASESGREC